MMQWTKDYMRVPSYEHTSTNQHGDRYKVSGVKKLSVARLSCKTEDATGLTRLILLSHHLDVPVRYSFKGDQEAYIEIVGREALRGCI